MIAQTTLKIVDEFYSRGVRNDGWVLDASETGREVVTGWFIATVAC